MPAPHRSPPTLTVKAAGAYTAAAVLTVPTPDRVGDIVRPAGLDTAPFLRNPVANWHHCCPVGRASVELVNAPGYAGPVLKGTTRFFQSAADLAGLNLAGFADKGYTRRIQYRPADCLTAAEAAWRLVDADLATGVSIEFTPVEMKALAGKPVRNPDGTTRPPADFTRAKFHGYAHTLADEQVHPGAMTLLKASNRLDRLIAVHETGKVNGWPLPAAFRESVAHVVKAVPARPATVKGGYTPEPPPMDELDDLPPPDESADLPDEMTPDEVSDKPPSAAKLYAAADAATAQADELESGLAMSEATKFRKKFDTLIADYRAVAEDAMSLAEAVEAAVTGKADEPSDLEDSDPEDADGVNEPSDLEEMPALKAKVVKGRLCVPVGRVLKAWPRRFKAAELTPVQAPGRDAEIAELLAAAEATLTKTDRAGRAIRRAIR